MTPDTMKRNEVESSHGMHPEDREFLIRESDHYYQSELAHDQRVSWILALASGCLFAFLPRVSSVASSKTTPPISWVFVLGLTLLAVCILACIYSLWPLMGSTGSMLNPFVSMMSRSSAYQPQGKIDLRKHFEAHKRRASIKARRASLAMLLLLCGICVTALSICVEA